MKAVTGYLKLTLTFAAILALVGVARADEGNCGPMRLPGQYGPWDYRVNPDKLIVVFSRHFTPGVQNLTEQATGFFGGDIDFTLRAAPNYPPALTTLMRLAEKEKTEKPNGLKWNVECYFDRAIRWRSDDGDVRMLYGMYLAKHGRYPEALEQLKLAESVGELSANGHYNLGLIYFRMKKYDEAMDQARLAYAQGYTLPGLRKLLQGVGKWQPDPPATPKPVAVPPPATDHSPPAVVSSPTSSQASVPTAVK